MLILQQENVDRCVLNAQALFLEPLISCLKRRTCLVCSAVFTRGVVYCPTMHHCTRASLCETLLNSDKSDLLQSSTNRIIILKNLGQSAPEK